MIGKHVVIDTLDNFKAKLDQIPSSAIVLIKDVGQIYAHGTYFGAQKTYSLLTKTADGLAPKGGTSASSQISDVNTEWVLTVTNGENPTWRKLPANAFSSSSYTLSSATTSDLGGIKVGQVYTATFDDLLGQYYKVNIDKNGLAYVHVPWINNPYTASGSGITLKDNVFSLSLNSVTKLDSAIGNKIYAVSLDKNEKLCVSVPWTDTNNIFVGATETKNGSSGMVPAPIANQHNYFLRGDGTWVKPNLSDLNDDVVNGKYLPKASPVYTGILSTKEPGLYQEAETLFFRNASNTADYGTQIINNWNDGSSKTTRFILDKTGIRFIDVNGYSRTIYHSGNFNPSDYVPLTGGVAMTGTLAIKTSGTILTIRSSNGGTPYINFRSDIDGTNTDLGDLGVDTSKNLVYYKGGWKKVWHEGNLKNLSDLTDDIVSGKYLPLSGGVLSDDLYFGNASTGSNSTGTRTRLPSHLYRNVYDESGNVYDHYYNGEYTASTYTFANLRVKNDSRYKILRFGGDGTFTWDGNTVIHSGNIGSQSVSYASSAKGLVRLAATTDDYSTYLKTYEYLGLSILTNTSGASIGNIGATYTVLNIGGNDMNRFGRFMFTRADDSSELYWQTTNNAITAWGTKRKIAFTDSNVASATKLQTARTIWGQSFDGTGDVNGVLTFNNLGGASPTIKWSYGEYFDNRGNFHLAAASGDFNIYNSSNDVLFRVAHSSGNVGIGTTNPGYKLDVSGGVYTSDSYYAKYGIFIYSGNSGPYLHGTGISWHNSSNAWVKDLFTYSDSADTLTLHRNTSCIGTATFNNQIISKVADGTAPLTVISTTKVANLNADLLGGYHADSFPIRGKHFVNSSAKTCTYNTWTRVLKVANGDGWGTRVLVIIQTHHNATVMNTSFLCTFTYSGRITINELSGNNYAEISIRVGSDNNYGYEVYIDICPKSIYSDASTYHVRAINLGCSSDTITHLNTQNVTALTYSSERTSTKGGAISSAKFIGDLVGNADTATALSSSAGSSTNPIYFSGGKPVACTYSLNATVPSDAIFTDTKYTAGKGLILSDSNEFSIYVPRVIQSCNDLPGRNKFTLKEYQFGEGYNLPSQSYYHIYTSQGQDVRYATQLALGMTAEQAYYRVYYNGTWKNWHSIINTDTTYSAGTGISISGTTISNSGVRSVSSGSANGTISVNTGGTSADVSVTGLGSLAYKSSIDKLTDTSGTSYNGGAWIKILQNQNDLVGNTNASGAWGIPTGTPDAQFGNGSILRLGWSYGQYYTDIYTGPNMLDGKYGYGLYWRQVVNGSTKAWRILIDTDNYNYYVPKLDGTGATGTWGISISGNATTATKLATSVNINGTSFNGASDITTSKWGTSRSITIGNTAKSVDGSGNVSWSSNEIGYHYKWWNNVKVNTWSRLCFVNYEVNVIGCKFLLNVSGTRNSVVFNDLYAITAHHSKSGNIVKLCGSHYSTGYKLRILSNSSGSCYVEMYDNLVNPDSITYQSVYCRLIPIFTGAITLYESYTAGSIPSGYNEISLTQNSYQIQGSINASATDGYSISVGAAGTDTSTIYFVT